MTYEPIYIKFPEPDLDQPVLSVVCNNYLSLDFYETDREHSDKSFNGLIESADLKETFPYEDFDIVRHGSERYFSKNPLYHSYNTLFENNKKRNKSLSQHQYDPVRGMLLTTDSFTGTFHSSYQESVEYSPLNPQVTSFYPSIYNVSLSSPSTFWNTPETRFGNISSLDASLTITNPNTDINDGITVSSINILRNFYHDQMSIFKKDVYRQDTGPLLYASGSTRWSSFNQDDLKAKLNNALKDANIIDTQNVSVELGESKMTKDASSKIDFSNLPKEAVNVKLNLENNAGETITIDCLVDDFYVSLSPTRSKTSKLNRFMEKYALCVPPEDSLYNIRGYTFSSSKRDEQVEAYRTQGDRYRLNYVFTPRSNRISYNDYNDDLGSRSGMVAGFSAGLVIEGENDSSSMRRDGNPGRTTASGWLPEEKGLLIHIPDQFGKTYEAEGNVYGNPGGLFDYLRYATYQSRLAYLKGDVNLGSHNYAERHELKSKGTISSGLYPGGGRIGYDGADPLNTVFVHTYYLKASFYPKRINILTNSDSFKNLTEAQKTSFGLQHDNQPSHGALKTANKSIRLRIEKASGITRDAGFGPETSLDEYGKEKSNLKAKMESTNGFLWNQDGAGQERNRYGTYRNDGFFMYRAINSDNPTDPYFRVHEYLRPANVTNAYKGGATNHGIAQKRPYRSESKNILAANRDSLTFSYSENIRRSISLKDDTNDRISNTAIVTHSSELDKIVPSIPVVGTSDDVSSGDRTSTEIQLVTPVISINSEIDLAQNKIVYTWFDRGATKNVKIAIDEINELGGASRLMQYQFGSADGIINVVRGKTTFSFNEDKTELTHNITEDVLKRTATANDSNLRYRFTIATFNGQEESDPISTIVEVNPDLESIQSSLIPYTPGLSLKTTTAVSATFDFIMSYDTSNYSDYRQQFDTIVVDYYESPASKQQFSIDRSSLSDTGSANTFQTSFTIGGLLSNKRYKFAATAINQYGQSDSSREIDASTPAIASKSKLKLSSNQNRQSNLNQTILNIESIGIKADSDSLLDIELKYKKDNITYPINTGDLSIASSQPIQDLIKRTKDTIELILVGFPGLYKIEATPIFPILGRGETVYIDVNIVHRPPGQIVQNRQSKHFNSKLLFADYSIIPLKDAGFYTSSAANQPDSDVTVSTKANLFFTTADVSTVEIMKPGYRTRTDSSLVEDISISFKPNDINYTFKPQHLVPLVSPGTTAYSNFGKIDLQPSFKFVIQKVTGQENQLVCVLGPDPFLRYDMSTGQMDRGPSVLNNIGNGTELLGGQFSRIRRQDGQTLPFKRHWNSLIPNLNQERINHAEYALFYLKLNNGENRFTNYYNYDKTTDTLYLQIMSNEAKQYVSIQNLIGVQVGSIQIPGSTNKQSIEYDSETIGKNPTNSIQFYEMLNTFLANNISSGSKQIKIKTKATIPDYLQDNAQATTTAVSVHTQPDNGFYAVTERETGRNFYNAKLSEDVLSNNSSALPQSWENLSNLPRNVLYEDSGFYIISDPAFTNDQSDQTISLNAPAIISISQNDGVGDQYQGFSVVTVKAKYEGTGNSKIDLNLFSFLGYVVEKYVDNEWVQINTLESSTEFFENNNFEGTFSFKIFLVDGAVKYRAFVRVKNIDGTIFKGKNVLIDKQIDNLLTEDFD